MATFERTTSMNTFRKRTRLEIEWLDSRVLLDGSVVAFVNQSGDLIVRGDDAANYLTIHRSAVGAPIEVSGQQGTAINGVVDGTTVIGSVLNIEVRLGDGNDGILVDSVDVPGIVLVSLGDGNDRATFDGVIGAIDLQGGNGTDDIDLSRDTQVFSFARIVAGRGNDEIRLRNTQIDGDLDIVAGDGDDFIDPFHVSLTGDLRINGGDGDDDLFLDTAMVQGNTNINFGAG